MNPHKVICKCKNVTKGEILEVIEKGASSYSEIKEITRAGAKCGKCKKKIKKFVSKYVEIESPQGVLTED